MPLTIAIATASVHVHNFLNKNGQYEVSRQALPPDVEALTPQSQCGDTLAHNAKAGAFLGDAQLGWNSRGGLGDR